jgi:cyclophilin family peptidyl-prolyl cis-trans isomerase
VGEPEHAITNAAGTLSMANTGTPESGGSQFFINVKGKKEMCLMCFDWFIIKNGVRDRSSLLAFLVRLIVS